MKTREFFVGQDYYGSAPAPKEWIHNELQDPVGECFFCPICSEIWARAIIVGQASMCRHRPCDRHSAGVRYTPSSLGIIHSGEIPGSLYLVESREWNASLPDRVVRRELALTLRWASTASMLPPGIASICKDMVQFFKQ